VVWPLILALVWFACIVLDDVGRAFGMGIGRLFLAAIHREQAQLRQLEAWLPEAMGPRCDEYTRWRATLAGVTCAVDRESAQVPPGHGRRYWPYWDRE
jgi:hypothetical protein